MAIQSHFKDLATPDFYGLTIDEMILSCYHICINHGKRCGF